MTTTIQDSLLEDSTALLLTGFVAGRYSLSAIPEDRLGNIITLAISHGLGPLLLWTVQQAVLTRSGQQGGGVSRWAPLVAAAQRSAARFALLDQAQRRVSASFEAAGIPAVWLKGIALAQTVYPQPWLRPMQDLDVLVPDSSRDQALRLAGELGFQLEETDAFAALGAPPTLRHHDLLVGGPGQAISLEVHFRLLGPDWARLLPEDRLAWFWSQAQVIQFGDRPVLILNPSAHLLYLCAHALLQHGEAYLSLLRLYDLHLLATKTSLDWVLVIDQAKALGWSYAVERALSLAVVCFGTPVPAGVLHQVSEQRSRDGNQTSATRLRQRVGRWEEWKLVFRSLPPSHRIRLLWITLFPPQSWMRQLYSVQPSHRLFPRFYLHRWLDGGREVARSLRTYLLRR